MAHLRREERERERYSYRAMNPTVRSDKSRYCRPLCRLEISRREKLIKRDCEKREKFAVASSRRWMLFLLKYNSNCISRPKDSEIKTHTKQQSSIPLYQRSNNYLNKVTISLTTELSSFLPLSLSSPLGKGSSANECGTICTRHKIN